MISVHVIDTRGVREGLPVSLVFWPNYRFGIPAKRLFLGEIMEQYTKPFFQIVPNVEEADFVAVPFDYFFAKEYAPEYLEHAYNLGRKLGKKVLLFDYTDYVDRNPKLPAHAVLFRVSAYRHHQRRQEIVMPYFVEDFAARYGLVPKEKGKPLTVGYCGQSRFGSTARKLKALSKRFLQTLTLHMRGDPQQGVHARGIFWRKTALAALTRSGMNSRIIERSFYSGHRVGVPLTPDKLRQDYVDNMRECDLSLCVRGDANASQRFYEALSASRIPLFLDTDCVLPLEEIIDYDAFVVRVPSKEVMRIGEYAHAFEKESAEGFLKKEKLARDAFDKYLRLDRYFSIVFDREKSPYAELLYGN